MMRKTDKIGKSVLRPRHIHFSDKLEIIKFKSDGIDLLKELYRIEFESPIGGIDIKWYDKDEKKKLGELQKLGLVKRYKSNPPFKTHYWKITEQGIKIVKTMKKLTGENYEE